MLKYMKHRVYVTPNSQDIIIDLGDDVIPKKVELFLERRGCKRDKIFKFESYNICNNQVSIRIPDEFLKKEVPNGFYDVEIKVNDCYYDKMEIIKRSGKDVKAAKTVDNCCPPDNPRWEDPECQEETCVKKDCISPIMDPCCGKPTVIVSEVGQFKTEPVKNPTTEPEDGLEGEV